MVNVSVMLDIMNETLSKVPPPPQFEEYRESLKYGESEGDESAKRQHDRTAAPVDAVEAV
jgi:hypothetical protein